MQNSELFVKLYMLSQVSANTSIQNSLLPEFLGEY